MLDYHTRILQFILEGLTMGGEDIELNDSWQNNGIVHGARLEIHKMPRTFENVVNDVREMNPHISEERLTTDVVLHPYEPLHITGDLDWKLLGISQLPESFGSLTVDGDLSLRNNKLASLPESFGSLTVGGYLWLYGNRLTSLPKSFGSLTVGKDFSLNYNQLTSLPESFSSLTVGGHLWLNDNQLTSLPESFGSLLNGPGHVLLQNNKLPPWIRDKMKT